MRRQLRFTGVGGQGVLLAGEILAEAQIKTGGYGVKAATYTSQVRGGPTKVDILLDKDEILYPYANDGEVEYMLSTAQVSYDQFKDGLREGAIIVVELMAIKGRTPSPLETESTISVCFNGPGPAWPWATPRTA